MNRHDEPERTGTKMVREWAIRLAIALVLPIGLAIGVALAQEEEPAEEAIAPTEPEPATGKGIYAGPAACGASGCHGSPSPVADSDVLMNEYDTWLHAPAPTHVRAWEVLLTPLSKRIARNLSLPNPPESSPTCTGCHSMVVPAGLQSRPGVIEVADGVSCEGCHGPAGGWLAEHVREDWEHLDSVEAGMTDLRNLPIRARTCLGCHLGDELNQVTHDFIAAGHPILTFELDNFTNSNLMPRHWKPNRARHGVRAWAVGQVVALQEETADLVRQVNGPQWPEFSHMSCASCHHPLREGEWRQERGYEHRPGMPLWSAERWIVLQHLVEIAAPDELSSLQRDIDDLSGEVGRVKDRVRIVELAESVEARLDHILPAVEVRRWTEEDVVSLIRAIANDAARYRIADRQSAEQATLSLITLVSELDASKRDSTTATVDELYRLLERLGQPDEYDRIAFSSELSELDL